MTYWQCLQRLQLHSNIYGEVKEYFSVFRSSSLKDDVKYFLGCCYIQLGYEILRHDVGVPVGSGLAPFIPTYFLIIIRRYKSEKLREQI